MTSHEEIAARFGPAEIFCKCIACVGTTSFPPALANE